jgi:uncharacterized protein with FMN-binding domain
VKRVIFSVTGTVLGIVALLSYKTHGPVTIAGAGLPSSGATGSSTPATSQTSTGAGAPPRSGTRSSTASRAAGRRNYVGVAEQTQYGVVQVRITVSGKKITNVGFVQLTAFDPTSQQINSAAAPILLQETLKAQSANINSVSGASYTSQGYAQSLQSAIDKAGI